MNQADFIGKLMLGPMAGVTDLPFRLLARECGADIVTTEMISAKGLFYGSKNTPPLLATEEKDRPVGVQLFGREPELMASEAEKLLEKYSFDFVDINMGCPMPKIAGNGDGCGLMREPELAGSIVEAVCKAVSVPVTVKMRKGWDRGSVNCVELSKIVEAAGAGAVTIHGRTRSMLYSGAADWDIIRAVKEAVQIPVIANGDVLEPEDAPRCLKRTGADLVMLGRGVFGDPWLLQRAGCAVRGEEIPERPPLAARVDTAVRQFELAREDKGEHIACLEARKHFAWYLRGVAYANYYKEKISRIGTMDDVYAIAAGIKRDLR